MKTVAIIMAGGRGTRLGVLSHKRAKPAMPFAGKYRIIDFVLSNCVNSGIFNVGILTQYRPHSLNDHIRTGRPWDLDRISGGVKLLAPYQRNGGALDWYRGTADAVHQNLDYIFQHQADTVLVLSGDHIYKMDYNLLLDYHHTNQADVTICAFKVPLEDASRFGTLVTDKNRRVIEFLEKPPQPPSPLVSMGVYAFRADVLAQRLNQDIHSHVSTHDFGRDVLPSMLALGDQIYAYHFDDYWVDVGTVEAYWEANMDLLRTNPPLDLRDSDWRIRTRSEERPPVNICAGAAVSNSIISNGCVIHGQVESSILSSGVHVAPGTVIRDSIIFNDCQIGPGAIVERTILDKNVVVGENAHVGFAEPHLDNLNGDIALIGKNTHLPAGIRVSRHCTIGDDLEEKDFATDLIEGAQHLDYEPFPLVMQPPSPVDTQRLETQSASLADAHRIPETRTRVLEGDLVAVR